MPHHELRVRDKDSLTTFLGWFSIGLGLAQATAPRAMSRLIGADDEGAAPRVMRLLGARELTQGSGILLRPRPTLWTWSRVAGDALDLGLLGLVAAKNDGARRARTAFAIANVLMVAVPDVYESRHLSSKTGPVRSGKRIRKAVTINRPDADVRSAWTAATAVREKVEQAGGTVTFAPAPGERGTELAVDFTFDPPAGDFGALASKLTGHDLATELSDDLRRLKQELETGLVTRSDSTPAGHDLANHLKQRAAQPVPEGAR